MMMVVSVDHDPLYEPQHYGTIEIARAEPYILFLFNNTYVLTSSWAYMLSA